MAGIIGTMMPAMARAPVVVVRDADEDDAPPINDIYNHYVRTSHVTFDVEPMTVERRLRWLAERSSARYRVLVAEEDGKVVGFASSGPYMPRPAYETSVLFSVYLDPDRTGRGIGTTLYAGLFESIRDADVHRALAGISLPNPGSVALHRRFGFEEVGRFSEQGRKFGRYRDVAWFERPMPRPLDG